jgi:hypothetical protein
VCLGGASGVLSAQLRHYPASPLAAVEKIGVWHEIRRTDNGCGFHVRIDRWPEWACRRAPGNGGTTSNAGGLSAVYEFQT